MKKLIATLLLIAPAVLAQDAPRKAFPDDYTPTKCPTITVQSYQESELASAASAFFAFTLDMKWIHEHFPAVRAEIEKEYPKVTTCFATASNTKMGCLDVMADEFRNICPRLYSAAYDREVCLETVETYVLGLDQRLQPAYLKTRECALQHPDTRTNKTLDVWTVPASITSPKAANDITIFSIDHDTHVPILASVSIEDQRLFAPSNPTGEMATGYIFKWPLKYAHVKTAEGREETVGPMVTVKADGYPTVSFRMNVAPPTVSVSTDPALSSLKRGRKNTLTVYARDAAGHAVDGRVMLGKTEVGRTNTPITVTLPKKGAELWVADLSNDASDVVVK